MEVPCHRDRQLWRYGLEDKRPHTFRVLPRRWVVERTFAWMGRRRRLSKDYEATVGSSEAFVKLAMIHLMARRLARNLKR